MQSVISRLFLREGDGAPGLIFARGLSAGGYGEDDRQTLTWVGGAISGQDLFFPGDHPRFIVEMLDGELVGRVEVRMRNFGSAVFRLFLVDDGGFDPTRGDRNSSGAIEFEVVSEPRNTPPVFVLAPNISVVENSGRQVVFGFATGISSGSVQDEQGEQNITFSVSSVAPGGSGFSSLLSFFELDLNGTLTLEVLPGRLGAFVVTIKAEDDGDTEGDSFNRSFADFTLTVVREVETDVIYEPNLFLPEASPLSPPFDQHYFTLPDAPPPHAAPQFVTFNVTVDTLTDVLFFETLPAVRPDGSLFFRLSPFANGFASFLVSVSQKDRPTCVRAEEHMGGAKGECTLLPLRINVLAVNQAPTFVLPSFLSVVQDSPLQALGGFVQNISAGPREEFESQSVTFDVSFSAEAGLFSVQPRVSSSGELTYAIAAGRHGVATISVACRDDGGTENGGEPQSDAQILFLKVFPLPVVASVMPAVISTIGGATITVHGSHFGSKYSRGYGSPVYHDVSVYVGGARCTNVRVVTDATVTCTAPAGVGASTVTVNVTDGALSRSGFLDEGLTQNLFYFGGSKGGAGANGFGV